MACVCLLGQGEGYCVSGVFACLCLVSPQMSRIPVYGENLEVLNLLYLVEHVSRSSPSRDDQCGELKMKCLYSGFRFLEEGDPCGDERISDAQLSREA